jgi:hypothetical protein
MASTEHSHRLWRTVSTDGRWVAGFEANRRLDEAEAEAKSLAEQLRGAVSRAALLRDTLMEIRDASEPGSPIHVAAASALVVYAGGQS